jgi:hypothetical protein
MLFFARTSSFNRLIGLFYQPVFHSRDTAFSSFSPGFSFPGFAAFLLPTFLLFSLQSSKNLTLLKELCERSEAYQGRIPKE